ncbi:efflux RND transporter permease subunit [Bosea sp. TAB14]|uniref:efflux RND transporter permease subunit n=1 Tax=Bosea sp. TAB14 TaxID=3237481 RepID=UPI003F90FF53
MFRFAHFFIDRPIFATVLSILLTIAGAIAQRSLPIAEYPEIAPPTVSIRATYPGASAETVAATVATPIEQEVNGVDDMLYITSQSTGDGVVTINVVFKGGTDIDQAQVLVQNRVSQAEPRLPQDVRALGVQVRKASPDFLMVINMISPDGSRDAQYISNYASLYVKDVLTRVDGVGDVQVFGARDFSMRIWLDPAKVASRNLTASDVVAALRAANVQVAAGALNQPPAKSNEAFQLSVNTLGRLTDVSEFENIVVRSDADGGTIRVRDIARVELGSQDYTTNAYLDNRNTVAIGVFQRPGSNALATSDKLIATMSDMSKQFPPGLEHRIIYNPTEFIAQSVDAVVHTLFEAMILVVVVVILFLQTWRAAVIPIVAIPVSLVGTFLIMSAVGISFNTISLLALVLAIGIVVDDAIVVVENVERYLAQGMSPKEAAHKTMDEVGGALLAIALVLCAVFIPTAFISGLQGTFYQQFAVTIAASTAISCFVSLTLSPAMSALLLKPHKAHDPHEQHGFIYKLGAPVRWFFHYFNAAFDWLSRSYGRVTSRLIRLAVILLIVYAGLIALTAQRLVQTPTTQGIFGDLRQQMFGISEAFTLLIEPPAISGIGNGGGLKGYVQDRSGRGLAALEGAAWTVAGSAGQLPFIVQPFTLFSTKTPQIYADIDRTKAEMLGVPVTRIFETLSIYMGSAYINDFNLLGRTFRVTAQADNPFRLTTRDVANLKTRNADGEMVPIGSVATFKDTTGAYRVPRYNLYPAAEVQLSMAHGYSTGQGIAAVEKIAAERLPAGFGFEWTEIALQEKLAGNTAIVAFGLAVVFVFLLLAALYESWLLPLAVILIVPMCILAAMFGVNYANLDRNILVDIGLVVLVGLAAKNAILIVEFAKQAEDEGMNRRDAAIAAARTRLRPILMTSVAFILGVLPLTISAGAGAEMRQAMGIAVFSGMLGVTFFGLIFTPVFYVMVRWLADLRGTKRKVQAPPPAEPTAAH